MTPEIKKVIESTGAVICPKCDGEGEVGTFCGHVQRRKLLLVRGAWNSQITKETNAQKGLCDLRR